MTDLERLLAIEEIKKIKAKYFYYLDHKDWESWKREVFAPDASMDVPEALSEPIVGIDNILAWVIPNTAHQVSTHHGHMPDIDVLSDTEAKGVWAMEDILRLPEDRPAPLGYTYLHGWGHYHETYVKLPQGWRIRSTRLTRLHLERS